MWVARQSSVATSLSFFAYTHPPSTADSTHVREPDNHSTPYVGSSCVFTCGALSSSLSDDDMPALAWFASFGLCPCCLCSKSSLPTPFARSPVPQLSPSLSPSLLFRVLATVPVPVLRPPSRSHTVSFPRIARVRCFVGLHSKPSHLRPRTSRKPNRAKHAPAHVTVSAGAAGSDGEGIHSAWEEKGACCKGRGRSC